MRPPPLPLPLFHASVARRQWLALAACGTLTQPLAAQTLTPRPRLAWPADHGAHPQTTIEWWYLTGWLQWADAPEATPMGFQLTFFRRLVPRTQHLSSPLAAKHLIAAHAAISLPQQARQWHAQRSARWDGTANAGAVRMATQGLDVRLDHPLPGWHLRLDHSTYAPSLQLGLSDQRFALSLAARPTQALLLQGEQGISQKGPTPAHQSVYVSWPHLAVQGQLRTPNRRPREVTGRAWLDHEWSNGLMPPNAVGWDWVGLMWDDGHSLMAFQMRAPQGKAVWRAGSWRSSQATQATHWPHHALRFEPLRTWQSPQTGARYPVAWRVHTPQGVWRVEAVFDQQELDGRASTGIIYWEGLVSVHHANGQRVGWGYLEMTGYQQKLRL